MPVEIRDVPLEQKHVLRQLMQLYLYDFSEIDGDDVSLTPKEFDLLATFARFPNVTLDREQLLDLVWGTSFYALRTVDVHVARLREKLKSSPLKIETVWGTGYRLAAEP